MLRESAESLMEQVAGAGSPQKTREDNEGVNVINSSDNKQDIFHFEEILKKLGAFGKFQLLQCAMCLSPMTVFAFKMLGFVFIGYTPPHVCNKVNETELLARYSLQYDSTALISYEECHIKMTSNQSGVPVEVASVSCPKGRHFPDGKHITLVSEWDLVCESGGMAEFAFMLAAIGDIVGSLIVPSIADRFGRKRIMTLCVILQLLIETTIAFSPNIVFYCFTMFLDGVIITGILCTYIVLGMELLITRHRQVFGIVACYFWVGAVINVGVVAYLLRNISWRYFQISGALTGVFSLPMIFCLHESVRWLALNRRIKDALDILKKASKQNNTDFSEVKSTFERYMASLSQNETKKHSMTRNEMFCDTLRKCLSSERKHGRNVRKYTLINLMTRKDTLIILVIMWYLWTTCNYTSLGIYMSSSDLAGNRFLNFCLIALMEVPCNIVIMFLMKRMGRLPILRIFLILAAICLLASMFLTQFKDNTRQSNTATLVLFLISAFAVSCFYNLLYIVTPEMFPTVLRSAGNGSCRAIPKIGYMLAPYTRPLYAVAKWAPVLIFASLCIIALPLTFLLPEMKDRVLPTKLSDVVTPKSRAEKEGLNPGDESTC